MHAQTHTAYSDAIVINDQIKWADCHRYANDTYGVTLIQSCFYLMTKMRLKHSSCLPRGRRITFSIQTIGPLLFLHATN